MKRLQILVLSSHAKMLKIILRALNKSEYWEAVGTKNFQEGIQEFQKNKIDIILFGIGVTPETASKATSEFQKSNPNLKTVWHYGGGTGLLFNEIYTVLNN